jgi:hypothetical protein
MDEQKIEEIVANALRKVCKEQECRYSQCMKDAEISPTRHLEDHVKFHDMFGVIGRAGNRVIMVATGLVTAFLIAALGWGIIEVLSKKMN